METSNQHIKGGRVLGMFMNIRAVELKNVRSAEYTQNDMVTKITKYIKAEAEADFAGKEE